MKKLMSVMLGLSLMGGSAAFVFAQEKQAPTKQEQKNKEQDKDKKGKAEVSKDKGGKGEKGKEKKQ